LHDLLLQQFWCKIYVGFQILTAMVAKNSVLWDTKPRSPFKKTTGVSEEHVASCFILVSCLTYFTVLKMEAIYSSQMLVVFQWTILRHIPEDRNLCKYMTHLSLEVECSNQKQLSCKFTDEPWRICSLYPIVSACRMSLAMTTEPRMLNWITKQLSILLRPLKIANILRWQNQVFRWNCYINVFSTYSFPKSVAETMTSRETKCFSDITEHISKQRVQKFIGNSLRYNFLDTTRLNCIIYVNK
jgi:hypothetical protein